MQNGVVKWFNDSKGFGFIESQGKDYFLHFKEIQSEGFKSVKQGDKVRFIPSQSPKGIMATQVYLGHD
jgi:CspA family cold shock protein